MCHTSVHPLKQPPMATRRTPAGENVVRGAKMMKDVQGMPGTYGGLQWRLLQLVMAVAALYVMYNTKDFPSVSAYRYLVAAACLQSLWSFALAIVDLYALLVGCNWLQNYRVVCLFAVGDGITSAVTFGAACASAGVTLLVANDLGICTVSHYCPRFVIATGAAFYSWFTTLPSFFLNFWALASS